jgi:predicted nucleotidyltransferase
VKDVAILKGESPWTLDDLASRLRGPLERAGAVRGVVFGSYARGTADAFSDLDLVVVLETDAPRFERARLLDEVYRAVPMGLDLLVYTPEELARGCDSGLGIFDRITREGVTVYEREHAPA